MLLFFCVFFTFVFQVMFPIISSINHWSLSILFRVYICQSFDLCIDMLLQSVDIMIKAML